MGAKPIHKAVKGEGAEQPETGEPEAATLSPEVQPEGVEAPPVLRTVEEWAEECTANPHMLAGARVLKNWALGRMLTREAFLAGMAEMTGLKVSSTAPKKKGN
jgi:hypothetical protein